ncbi:MAG: sugar phosphate isomerase/epimerase [Clostridia bacterium]|nr:sugar phosphate isomerase/epimerase [Clostridia bacterium]
MSLVLCSTGAMIGTPNGRDHTIMKSALPSLRCDGYEFMMYDTWYEKADTVIDFITKNNFNIPIMHFDKKIGELVSRYEDGDLEKALELFKINCNIANKIGVHVAVFHLWGGLDSDKCFSHNMDAYALFNKIAKEHSILLLIENIVCNNESPMARWMQLYERYPDISFIFDTKMAQFHGEMELLYDNRYRDIVKRIKHFHVNDYAGGCKEWSKFKTLHIGKGNIDFRRFFEFIKSIGYNGTFTVEGTSFDQTGRVDTVSLNNDFEYIRNNI